MQLRSDDAAAPHRGAAGHFAGRQGREGAEARQGLAPGQQGRGGQRGDGDGEVQAGGGAAQVQVQVGQHAHHRGRSQRLPLQDQVQPRGQLRRPAHLQVRCCVIIFYIPNM